MRCSWFWPATRQHKSTRRPRAKRTLSRKLSPRPVTPSLPADRQQFRREMEATFTHPVPDDSLAVNTPLTCTELRRALASIKKVKVSTRVDTVSYRMLKEAPESVTAVKGKVVLTMYADDLAIWTGHPLQTSPHKQLVGQTQHETVPGSCGRGGPLYPSKWIRSLFAENCVRPIPHQHLSEHGGAQSGWTGRASLHRKKSSTWVYTSLAGRWYEPAGRAQRAERLPSPQRDQGGICSALGEHPQDPSERGAGPGALTPVVRTGSHAAPLENGSSPSHRHRGARSATGPRAAAVRAAVPGVQRGRAPPVPPPHPARL